MDDLKKTYYPHYNVLKHKDEWDEHTRQVIQERFKPKHSSYFSTMEREILTDLSHHIFPSHLGEISIHIIDIFDERCSKGSIRGYRPGTTLPKTTVIDTGLKHIDEECILLHQLPFIQLEKEQQQKLITQWFVGDTTNNVWKAVTSVEFFKTLTAELIPIVYSDPSIWSHIGFGGPAFPHGYYAFGPKQFDNSEAPLHDSTSTR
ncbi:gluconate 2-dehydrogenase subunit 3 family protein [Bacillus solimangrovi]|uniref:Gluconate 2-dehydrogenase n=1 Tax=Bacillus solimangrovi TaxID=1305675 RepID=A0A1E5LJU2_9BACI|nr:gluconate 2-dehydrogenase subunit 3 family protein [Bacillus solimangrovi]OEH94350.1 hypothetical protein BFG57_08830 [Bacillus solimangrovi]